MRLSLRTLKRLDGNRVGASYQPPDQLRALESAT